MLSYEAATQIAARAKSQLERIYGSRLRGVYLFGSWVRREADADSDVDIMSNAKGAIQDRPFAFCAK